MTVEGSDISKTSSTNNSTSCPANMYIRQKSQTSHKEGDESPHMTRNHSFVTNILRGISVISRKFSTHYDTDDYGQRHGQRVEIHRPVYSLDHFDTEYGYETHEVSTKTWMKEKLKKQCTCSKKRLTSIVYSFFPILTWIKEYNPKIDCIADLLAGLTVGIMSIPQGMAYSRLVGVPPQLGLYTNIIPTILYVFFGSSRLAAIGTVAVVSLMMGNIRYKNLPVGDYTVACNDIFGANHTNGTIPNWEFMSSSDPACFSSIDLAAATCMLSGLLLLLMGFLRLGFVSYYLSDQLVGGFTSGAAIHVFTSQIDVVFGIDLPKKSGIGKIVLDYYELFHHIKETNIATLVGSIICIIFLLFCKELVDHHVQKRFKVPVPSELIVVIVGTLISYFAGLHNLYDMKVVGRIPSGFPTPKPPRFDIMGQIFVDALVLAIVNYSLSVSLAKLYAKRNNYKIDPYQEFFSYSIINVAGSFFTNFPSGQSVARSIVYEGAGARSQFAGAIGTIVVIFTIYVIAPFLATLPTCVLGSIIVVACIEMLKQVKELKPLFLTSKIDFSIYIFTFIAVVFLDVTEGLAASILFAFLTVIFRTQCPHIRLMGNIPDTDLYGEVDHYTKASQTPGLKVFHYNAPLYYANVENFKPKLFKKCNVDPVVIKAQRLQQLKKQNKKDANTKKDLEAGVIPVVEDGLTAKPECDQAVVVSATVTSTGVQVQVDWPRFVVIDCSGFSYIDLMGVNVLKQVYTEFNDIDITVFFADCNVTVRKLLQVSKFYDTVPKSNVFVSVHDAVTSANRALSPVKEPPRLRKFGLTPDNSEQTTVVSNKMFHVASDECDEIDSGVSEYDKPEDERTKSSSQNSL